MCGYVLGKTGRGGQMEKTKKKLQLKEPIKKVHWLEHFQGKTRMIIKKTRKFSDGDDFGWNFETEAYDPPLVTLYTHVGPVNTFPLPQRAEHTDGHRLTSPIGTFAFSNNFHPQMFSCHWKEHNNISNSIIVLYHKEQPTSDSQICKTLYAFLSFKV